MQLLDATVPQLKKVVAKKIKKETERCTQLISTEEPEREDEQVSLSSGDSPRFSCLACPQLELSTEMSPFLTSLLKKTGWEKKSEVDSR